MALAPGDHLVVPRVSIYRPPGYRLRNKLVDSGERMLPEADVMEIGGILVTKPLRTACDVGRLLHRDQAFAAMDCVIRAAGFSVAELVAHVERFRCYRGVVQLRELAPEVDPRSESPGESILRRRWRDCAVLPVPELQIPVEGPDGVCFLDLGLPELRYAAEYDGLEWHGPERQRHDTRRREWISRHGSYAIDVFTAGSVHGPAQDATERLVRGILAAMRRRG
ncbi:MAG TPA: hypothetical protein PLP61_11345 [Nocardioides sp.]|uniref:hypothetical protein n=1 Tax=Nocardioides sp. TaxID=35761 RepID=UPI002C614A9F|nr:hypothetical protein [Nocardioides sp.]HQR27624.1 hypothetical protein [Nocardioides sp.]